MTISHGGESGIFSAVLNVKEAHRTISSLASLFRRISLFSSFVFGWNRQK
jgi:hypothetical protein